ncbi:hypothetical protein VPH35_046019 [Triticum aestivum]
MHLPNGPFHTHGLLPVTMPPRSRIPTPPALRLTFRPAPRQRPRASPPRRSRVPPGSCRHRTPTPPSSAPTTSATYICPDHFSRRRPPADHLHYRSPPRPPLSPPSTPPTSVPALRPSHLRRACPNHLLHGRPPSRPPPPPTSLRRDLPSAPSRPSLCSSAACPLLRRVLHNLPSLSTATATQGAIARHRPICFGCCYFV